MSGFMDRLLFPRRVDSRGSVIPAGLRTRFYQAVFERGWSLPWIYSARRCSQFWDIPAGQTDVANRPEDYAFGPIGIMRYVLEFIRAFVSPGASVLEIGCNAGSKLEQMRKAGFNHLAGLEINPACFDVMRSAFPELFSVTKLYAGTAEQSLPTLETNQFDFIYSISSIQHVHPRQLHVFSEIARICSGHLLTLEIEWAGGRYFFPRNYQRVFEPLGFRQLASAVISRDRCPEPELDAYWGHVMRLFVKNSRVA